MDVSLSNLLNGSLLAGLIAVVALVLNQRSQLVRIETLLTGANGDNGLVGDMKTQRQRTHTIANDINTVKGQLALHELRVEAVERRVGPEDRRSA